MATVKTAVAGADEALPAIHPGTSQVVATSASSAQSTALGATLVRLCCTQDVWVKFGSNPTADKTTSILLPGLAIEYFGCLPTDKLAAIQDSAGGSLCITPGLDISP